MVCVSKLTTNHHKQKARRHLIWYVHDILYRHTDYTIHYILNIKQHEACIIPVYLVLLLLLQPTIYQHAAPPHTYIYCITPRSTPYLCIPTSISGGMAPGKTGWPSKEEREVEKIKIWENRTSDFWILEREEVCWAGCKTKNRKKRELRTCRNPEQYLQRLYWELGRRLLLLHSSGVVVVARWYV